MEWKGCNCYDSPIYGYIPLNDDQLQQALAVWSSIKTMTGSPTGVAPSTTSAVTAPTCSCNENGCSDDSPACCANGSCATQTAIPHSGLTMGPLVCTPWLNSYSSCHKDMDPKKLNETAEHLVENQITGSTFLINGNMTNKSANFTQVYDAGSGVSYIANVGWIPGCTKYASQNPLQPSRNPKDQQWAYNIVYWNWNWKNCKSA